MNFDCHFALFSYLAIIGPPRIQVEALANSLHMRFLAPKIKNEPETWSMRNIYNSWTYHVQYWKNGSDEKVSTANHLRRRYKLPLLCSVLVGGRLCQVAAPYGPEQGSPTARIDPI